MNILTKILTKFRLKRIVQVNFPVSGINTIESIPGFKPYFEYYQKEDCHPREWGKLEIGQVVIKFMAIPGI